MKPFELRGIVMLVTNRSFLLFDDTSGREIFIPHQMVLDWSLLEEETPHDMTTKMLERDDFISVEIPTWLAEKEGL